MNVNEFKTRLQEIENCISKIADLKQSIIDDMKEHGHESQAKDFDTDVCEWFPAPFPTKYEPFTLDEMVDEYGDLFTDD